MSNGPKAVELGLEAVNTGGPEAPNTAPEAVDGGLDAVSNGPRAVEFGPDAVNIMHQRQGQRFIPVLGEELERSFFAHGGKCGSKEALFEAVHSAH